MVTTNTLLERTQDIAVRSVEGVMTWQVWTYSWVDEHGKPIPERRKFDWMVFTTRGAAESYWYDSAPGRNDKATFIKA